MAWSTSLALDIIGEFAGAQIAPEPRLFAYEAFMATRERERSRDRRERIYAIDTLYQKWLADTRWWAANSYQRMRADPVRWERFKAQKRTEYHRRKHEVGFIERKRECGRAAMAKIWKRKSADPQWMENRRRQRREQYAGKVVVV
jgi:hypothetical protein